MWAVMFQIERDELAYDTGKDLFSMYDKPLLFKTKQEAEERAKVWNTGVVVPYIRPMSVDEIQSSIQRDTRNGK